MSFLFCFETDLGDPVETDVVCRDRYFTQKRAAEYGLTGWVRNTDNNKVRSSPLCNGFGGLREYVCFRGC